MSHIRSKDTKPELIVRKFPHTMPTAGRPIAYTESTDSATDVAGGLGYKIVSLLKNSLTMLTAIQGTYENGQIIWHEPPPVQERTEVIVTFLKKEDSVTAKPRQAGSLKGRGSLPADFNEPLDDFSEYM